MDSRIAEEWRREEPHGSVYSEMRDTRNGPEKRWVAQFRAKDHTGKNRTYRDTRSTSKKQAKRALLELKKRAFANKQAPTHKDMEPQTLAAYLEKWHEQRKSSGEIRPNTANDADRYIKVWTELLGTKKVNAIAPHDVEMALHALEIGRWKGKRRSLQMAFRCLRKALEDVRPRLNSNPCDAVSDKPSAPKPDTRAFTQDELRRIVAASDKPIGEDTMVDETFSALVLTLAYTGLRINEACGLVWADVDLDGSRIHVRKALVRTKGLGAYRSEPKTKNARRTIRVGSIVTERLRKLRQMTGAIPHGTAFVFASERGGPLHDSNLLRRRWHPLLKSLKLDTTGFHILRHTYASVVLQAGLDIGTVSKNLGHASPSITLAVYAHFMPGREQEAVDAVALALSGPSAS